MNWICLLALGIAIISASYHFDVSLTGPRLEGDVLVKDIKRSNVTSEERRISGRVLSPAELRIVPDLYHHKDARLPMGIVPHELSRDGVSFGFDISPVRVLRAEISNGRALTRLVGGVWYIAKTNMDGCKYVFGGGLPRVFNRKPYRDVVFDISSADFEAANYQVSAGLSFSDVASDNDGITSGVERSPKGNDTDTGYEQRKRTGYHDPKGPFSHIPLSGQILFAALMFVGGLYFFSYAFSESRSLKDEAALVYLLLGMGGIYLAVVISLFLVRGI